MSDITIVTAFYDIGRGDWTPDKGLPHYLQRTNDTYFERFGHMAKLDNDMIIFTSPDLAPKIKELRGDRPTQIVEKEFSSLAPKLRDNIMRVQLLEKYQQLINPREVKNPEYWNANYVLVNLLKASFITTAIKLFNLRTNLVAWLDFGYCRDISTLNGVTHWQYPFSEDKIHVFSIKEFVEGTYINDVIANNDVHITGPHIIAHKDLWPKLETMVMAHTKQLFENDLIDDDQTLLLMSTLSNPELFELHPVSKEDWFIIFKEYNESIS
jgi:protein YibB